MTTYESKINAERRIIKCEPVSWRVMRGTRVITDNEEIKPLEKIQFHRHSKREIFFY